MGLIRVTPSHPPLLLVGVVFLLLGTLFGGLSLSGSVASLPAPSSAPVSAHPVPFVSPEPASAVSTPYTATIAAVHNATPTTTTISSATVWTLSNGNKQASLAYGRIHSATTQYLSWNGTVTLTLGTQLEITPGTARFGGQCYANLGTLWVNLTLYSAGPTQNYSWSTNAAGGALNLNQPGGLCPVSPVARIEIAPSWTIPSPSNVNMGLSLSMMATPAMSFNGTAPKGLVSAVTPGSRGINALVPVVIGAAGAVPFDWGWSWASSPSTTSVFSFAAFASSGSITWSSPYKASATYGASTQSSTLGGTFTGVLSTTTIRFTAVPSISGSVPRTTLLFNVSFTVTSNITSPFLLTYNYTIGSVTTSTTLSATEVFPFNATYSVYVYSVTTPFGNVKKITMAGNRTWTYLSSWPGGATFYVSNNTVVWNVPPIPNATQIDFVAPNVYTPSTLTIVYIPASPVFGLFGAALPYSAVLTYVNGVFAPYATFSVSVGLTYSIRTFDVFSRLLQSSNVTVMNPPAQVASIFLNIWPMTVANMNSSYVIGLLITENSVTQTSPDIMPLGSSTYFLPAGNYTFTLNYLLLNAPTIAKTVQFQLNISGVSYSVVTGISFLNIQVTTTMVGNNISKLIQSITSTFVSTNISIAQLVQSIQTGLFGFHLNLGTASRTKNVFDFPIFVTNGANGVVNQTITSAIQTGLTVTYLNNTGSTPANFYSTAPTPSNFNLFLAATPTQIAEVTGGLGVFVLTSFVHIGTLTVMAAGVIGAVALNSAVTFGIPTNPLNQQLVLNLGNITRNSTSGVATAKAIWANGFNGTYGGEIVLTGAWLGTATNIQVTFNGVVISPNALSISTTQILVFAGMANISMGKSLYVNVSYVSQSIASLTAPIASAGPVQLTPPLIYLILSVIVVFGLALFEFFTGRQPGITFAALSFLMVVGGVTFL